MKTLTCISRITRDGLTDPDLTVGGRYSVIEDPTRSIAGELITVRRYGSRGPDLTRPSYLFKPFSSVKGSPVVPHRTISTIASEIVRTLRVTGKRLPGALPYLAMMLKLEKLTDVPGPGQDTGREIVCRFLSNAGTWQGGTARRIKRELKALLAAPDVTPASQSVQPVPSRCMMCSADLIEGGELCPSCRLKTATQIKVRTDEYYNALTGLASMFSYNAHGPVPAVEGPAIYASFTGLQPGLQHGLLRWMRKLLREIDQRADEATKERLRAAWGSF